VPVKQIKIPYIPAVNFTLPGLYAQRFHLDRGPDFDERDASGAMDELRWWATLTPPWRHR
jgi:hypothetical protein